MVRPTLFLCVTWKHWSTFEVGSRSGFEQILLAGCDTEGQVNGEEPVCFMDCFTFRSRAKRDISRLDPFFIMSKAALRRGKARAVEGTDVTTLILLTMVTNCSSYKVS